LSNLKQTLKSPAGVRYPQVLKYLKHVLSLKLHKANVHNYAQKQKNKLQILKNNPLSEQKCDIRKMY